MTIIIAHFKKYLLPASCLAFFFLVSCSGGSNENVDAAAPVPDSIAVNKILINED